MSEQNKPLIQSNNNKNEFDNFLHNNKWTTYLAYEINLNNSLKQQSLSQQEINFNNSSKQQSRSQQEINLNNSSKQQSLSQQENSNPSQNKIKKLYDYEALLTQCSYLSRMAYCPADIFCRMTQHLDVIPNIFNDYLSAIEKIYDDLFKYKCSYDSKYIQENPKFLEKFNQFKTISSKQIKKQIVGGPIFNNSEIKKTDQVGYFIQNNKKLNVYLYLHHNKKSNFNNRPTLFISFKGSSSPTDFIHDLKSAFSKSKPLNELNDVNENNDAKACSVFIDILKENRTINNIFNKVKQLIPSEQKKNYNNNKIRIIITGHSLGGALAELFGYYLKKYKSSEIACPIHIITFGACCVFNAAGRNEFNTLLNVSGDKIFTLDRITVNADPVVLLPAHLDHPGYTLLKTEFKAFTKTGRTNEIGEIRKMLGLEQGKSKENYDGNELLVSEEFIKLFKKTEKFFNKSIYNFKLYKSKYTNIFKNKINKKEAMPNLKKQIAGEPEPQSSEFRKNTKNYKQQTLEKMPNQINYSCYKIISKGFCHGVYMGVSYMNVLRLIGDKDPVKDYTLYKTANQKIFSLPDDGISFSHTNSNCLLLKNRIKTKFGVKKIIQNQTTSNPAQTANQQSSSPQNSKSGFSCSIL
jgi:hypothetical protein